MFKILAHHERAFGDAKFERIKSRIKRTLERRYSFNFDETQMGVSEFVEVYAQELYSLGFRNEALLLEVFVLISFFSRIGFDDPRVYNAYSIIRQVSLRAELRLSQAWSKLSHG